MKENCFRLNKALQDDAWLVPFIHSTCKQQIILLKMMTRGGNEILIFERLDNNFEAEERRLWGES